MGPRGRGARRGGGMRRNRIMTGVLGASVALPGGFASAAAKEASPPLRSPQVIANHYRANPAALMRMARDAARSRRTQESLVFTVLGGDVNERHEGVVRVDPLTTEGVRVRLDLGEVSLSIRAVTSPAGETRTELRGIRGVDPGRYVQLESEGAPTLASLQRLIPPVPVPVLALALGDERDWDQLLPLGEPVEWVKAEPQGAMWRVLGVSTGGGAGATPISVWLDGGTLAIRRVESVWSSPRGELRVRVDVSPAPALEPEAWGVDITGRVAVGAWTDLAAPPAGIAEDGVFPGTLLNERDGRVWTGAELGPGEAREHRYALVVLYEPAAGLNEASELVRLGSRARSALEADFARRLGAGEVPPSVRLWLRPAPCFAAAAFTAEGLSAEVARWRDEPGAGPVLFSLAPGLTLQAAAPGRGAVAVLVGAEMRVLGVYALDGQPEVLAGSIAARVRRNAWPGWEP